MYLIHAIASHPWGLKVRRGVTLARDSRRARRTESSALRLVVGCCCYILFAFPCSEASGSPMADEQSASNLKSDERIVFITTDARLSEDARSWLIPIHAWVHEDKRSTVRKAAISTTLRAKYGLKATPQTKANFDRRCSLLLADNERNRTIVIQLAGKEFSLPPTGPNGHAVAEFQLDAADVSKHADGDQLSYAAVLEDGDDRQFFGSVNLIPRKGISVISDFDDTVKVTQATDRAMMLDHSLYRDFAAAPGMAELYKSWAQSGATIHFVSSSPWHFYEPIEEFLNAAGFPRRSLSLKQFRFKDTTLMNLFLSGSETKPAQIAPILAAFPDRRFVLVGDSGQEDPEVYAAVIRKSPSQVERVYIRNVTQASPTDERFSKVFDGIAPEKWTLFDDPADLVLP